MKMRRYVFLRAVTLIMILCIVVSSAVAEEAIAVVDPETGVLMDQDGQPIDYLSLLMPLTATGGAGGFPYGANGEVEVDPAYDFSDVIASSPVNAWQIAARPHQSSFASSSDNNVMASKSIAPGNEENHFTVTLDVRAKLSWKYLLKYSVPILALSSNYTNGKYVTFYSTPPQGQYYSFIFQYYVDTPGGRIVLASLPAYLSYAEVQSVNMKEGTNFYYLYNEYLGGFLKTGEKMQFSSSNGTDPNNPYVYYISIDNAIYNRYDLLVPEHSYGLSVTDPMYSIITDYDGVVHEDSYVSHTETTDENGVTTLQWTLNNISATRIITASVNGKTSYLFQYAMAYDLVLDVEDPSFVEDQIYPANRETRVYYQDSHGAAQDYPIPVPEITGKLYDINLYKSNEEDPDEAVEGAEFELYHADGTPYIRSGQSDSDVYVTDENGWITIEDLPYGSYYLKEVKAPDGYLMPSEEDAVYGPFTLSYANLQSAGFAYRVDATNEKEPFGNLIVQKAVTGTGADPNQTFLFHVTCTGETGTLNFEFSLHAGEAQAISAIPAPFSYVIQEDDEWSWRYTYQSADPGLSGTVDKGETETVTVSNHYSEQRWEGDVTDKQNVFGAAE